MLNFCTLFDSNYLDRGIALYKSLLANTQDFKLYIVCFDELAYSTLIKLNYEHAVVIAETQILDDELRAIKQQRQRAEYCWTCTPVIIKYVLDTYQVDHCTYIDADMKFYSDPKVLLEELWAAKASVGIIEHHFPQNIAKKKRERTYGKYCVEFNTFLNDDIGRTVLNDWKESCFKKCTMEFGEESFGDQKYVEQWETRFPGIYVYKNVGAGVAPWNICDYRLVGTKEHMELMYRKKTRCNLIFYHFQSLVILNEQNAFIGVYNESGIKSKALISKLYNPYLRDLYNARETISKLGVHIPEQTLRGGEKNAVSKMKWKDFLIFCYQCIPGIVNGKHNYIKILPGTEKI